MILRLMTDTEKQGVFMDISIIATIAFTVIPTAAIVVLYIMMKGKKK